MNNVADDLDRCDRLVVFRSVPDAEVGVGVLHQRGFRVRLNACGRIARVFVPRPVTDAIILKALRAARIRVVSILTVLPKATFTSS